VQGTAEKTQFSQDAFLTLWLWGAKAVARMVDLQKMAGAELTTVDGCVEIRRGWPGPPR